jgi:predicted small lipoprotein YifL
MMRRLTSVMTPLMLALMLAVGLSACGKRGELRLPDSQLQNLAQNIWQEAPLTERHDG